MRNHICIARSTAVRRTSGTEGIFVGEPEEGKYAVQLEVRRGEEREGRVETYTHAARYRERMRATAEGTSIVKLSLFSAGRTL